MHFKVTFIKCFQSCTHAQSAAVSSSHRRVHSDKEPQSWFWTVSSGKATDYPPWPVNSFRLRCSFSDLLLLWQPLSVCQVRRLSCWRLASSYATAWDLFFRLPVSRIKVQFNSVFREVFPLIKLLFPHQYCTVLMSWVQVCRVLQILKWMKKTAIKTVK